jgi:hypothetical protein
MATIASLKVNILGDSTALSNSLKQATDKMQAFGDKATSIGQTLSTRLTLPIVGAGALMVKSFMTQEDAVAKMNAALRANGGQAGTTAKEIQDLASSLQKVTTFGDEVTISAASLLLTFHQVRNEVGKGNDVFNRTIKASQDLASAMGTDLQSATMQLAKALENPTIGLGALSRSGTTFTEQQKEMIKTLVESGRQLEAQTMILDVVESQYAGIAESMRKTTSGTIKGAINELGDEMESFGKIISEALIPFIARITDAVKFVAGLDEGTKRFVVTLGAFAAGIGPVVYGVGLLTSGIRALTLAMAANPYTAIAIGILAIASATYMAIKGVNDYEKALLKLAGVDAITGSEDERNKLLERQKVILRDLESAQGRLSRAQGTTARASEEGKIARYKEELGTIDQLLAKSNALSWQNYELAKSAREASEASQALKKGLGGTTTEAGFQSGSIGSLNEQLKELQAEFEATGNSVRRAQLAFQIRGITAEIERITAQTEPLDRLTIGVQKLGRAGLVRGQIPLAELPEKVKEMNTQLANSPVVIRDMTAQIAVAQQFAQQFTDSFGAGMANLVVQGGEFLDVLKNIGKLMLSAAIQTFIKYMLLGSVGFGVKGGSTGLIGGLFSGSASMAGMGAVTPASASLTLDGQFQIRGTDLVYVMNRAERSFR